MAELREQLQSRLSGAYTLGRELSGGGMSRVFVAEDLSLGRAVVPYLGLQLREQGRIAVLAGDNKRAARAYRHYLAMNQLAEPSMKPQVDSVKRELARVEGQR